MFAVGSVYIYGLLDISLPFIEISKRLISEAEV
jgi:hypothetical protein